MANKDIVVIGASTGGIEALKAIARDLPADLPAALFVVIHTGHASPDILHHIFDRAGPLPAVLATDGEPIRTGRIYVAPSDHHLILEQSGRMRISRGPKENRFRPAIDPLFRSAAHAFGSRVVGVVLTGFLDDGTAGSWAVKERGGTSIVQHPEEAVAPDMPLNALKNVEVDHCVPLAKIPPLITRLAGTPAEPRGARPMPKEMETEVKIACEENALEAGIETWGDPSLYACPECHGVLLELTEGKNIRFRCHTGHAYSIESLLRDYSERTEEALWNAIRSIEESALLLKRAANQLSQHSNDEAAAAMRAKAGEAMERVNLVRQIVLRHKKESRTGDPENESARFPA